MVESEKMESNSSCPILGVWIRSQIRSISMDDNLLVSLWKFSTDNTNDIEADPTIWAILLCLWPYLENSKLKYRLNTVCFARISHTVYRFYPFE